MSGSLHTKSNGSEPDIISTAKAPAVGKNKKTISVRLIRAMPAAQPNEAINVEAGPYYKTFTITFYFLKRFHQLKVMKVSRGYASPIYKIVLSSAMKTNSWVCWLQQQAGTWHLLLGNHIDEKLIATISLAIECQE
jgi:hypothetical protein